MIKNSKEELKKYFNKKKKIVRETKEIGNTLDSLIVKEWGFHYSETDDDMIIDTLDYGISAISFESFVRKMDEYKKNSDENDGEFGIVL